METTPKFESGQLIHHKRFGYRGVIISVDDVFTGADEWYEEVAQSRPPKDRPWYHILVDGEEAETYVAERNLEVDATGEPVDHPLVEILFDELRDGRYVRTRLLN
ncbi:MAG TPA: heat shock protein HspQ [Kofleriaceae bacterium]|nr:heat shock protein HspQ [Kofleriaceae bacterium]